ncbi:hypothetical protein BDB00DRAFT_815184, partial [Zychaea mexicana]|uniref:uncharacterized protein n=1 Tax=Zychaea mexicana TaxID=64656 RepID=UPI0022FEC6BA
MLSLSILHESKAWCYFVLQRSLLSQMQVSIHFVRSALEAEDPVKGLKFYRVQEYLQD